MKSKVKKSKVKVKSELSDRQFIANIRRVKRLTGQESLVHKPSERDDDISYEYTRGYAAARADFSFDHVKVFNEGVEQGRLQMREKVQRFLHDDTLESEDSDD